MAAPHPAPGDAPNPRDGGLVIDGVSKWFRSRHNNVHALDAVSLDIRPGEFVCIVGPSGCGKSTLLDIVAGLTRPDQGRVVADGQPVAGPERHRLVMFQECGAVPLADRARQRAVRAEAGAGPEPRATPRHRHGLSWAGEA